VSTIPKQVDLRVHDREALDEIELVTDVLGAVAASEGPLSRSELDQVLGLTPAVCTHSGLTPRTCHCGQEHTSRPWTSG
jgi:hypothetical protein